MQTENNSKPYQIIYFYATDWETEDEENGEALLVAESESDDEDVETCRICLNKFRDQDVGSPEACDHTFCLECIQEWSKVC